MRRIFIMTKDGENLIEFAPGMRLRLHDFKGYTYPTIELYIDNDNYITLGEYYSIEDCKDKFDKLIDYVTRATNGYPDFYFQM